MTLLPDVGIIASEQLADTLAAHVPEKAVAAALDSMTVATEPTLEGLTGLIVRVKRIHVIDNRKSVVLGGNPAADVYPLFMVASGKSERPVEIALPRTFNGIRDRQDLPIGEGFSIARHFDQLPPFLDIHVAVMRSLAGQREVAAALQTLSDSDEGKGMMTTIQTLMTAAHPLAGSTFGIGASLLNLVLKYMGAQQDRQIFYGCFSVERTPGGYGIGRLLNVSHKERAEVDFEVLPVRDGH